MSKFRLRAYYKGIVVFENSGLNYSDAICALNDIVDMIYNFNYKFGERVFDTFDFNYAIEEVE